MNLKPHWETQHDWWIEDFKFIMEQRKFFITMVRKHPDLNDGMGNEFRGVLKSVEKRVKDLKREYKKIYGVDFKMRFITE